MKKKATAPKGGALKRKTLDRKQPVITKQRETSVGSIAANLHEGSRSEYLAQYVFSSFGTAVPIPHQEDTGLRHLLHVARTCWAAGVATSVLLSTSKKHDGPMGFCQPEISPLAYRASLADFSLYRAQS